eukprot:15465217-Alexandrium_andersonii.AAC.1
MQVVTRPRALNAWKAVDLTWTAGTPYHPKIVAIRLARFACHAHHHLTIAVEFKPEASTLLDAVVTL